MNIRAMMLKIEGGGYSPVSFGADRQYIAALDGLRAISILFVIIRHFEITRLVSANLGVTIFFFISGFIITRLLIHEFRNTDRVDVFGFYMRRFFRLIPELVLMVGVVTAFALALSIAVDWGQVSAALFYYMNYYTIALRGDGLNYALPINPLWSLAVEEHYYLVFPLFFLMFVRRLPAMIKATMVLLVLILAWRLINIHLLGFTPKYNYFATESRIGTILWGCLLAVVADQEPKALLRRLLTSPFAGVVAGVALMATMFIPGEENRHSWRYSLQGVSLLFAIGAILFAPGLHWARAILSTKPMVFVGKISYSLYLWHLPVFFFLPMLLPVSGMSHVVLSLIISTALSCASFYGFAKPLMRWHRGRYAATRKVTE